MVDSDARCDGVESIGVWMIGCEITPACGNRFVIMCCTAPLDISKSHTRYIVLLRSMYAIHTYEIPASLVLPLRPIVLSAQCYIVLLPSM